jgi:hypothetical protein
VANVDARDRPRTNLSTRCAEAATMYDFGLERHQSIEARTPGSCDIRREMHRSRAMVHQLQGAAAIAGPTQLLVAAVLPCLLFLIG